MHLFDLHGRVAIVTGGNGGIGLAIARGLGLAGASVLIVGRNRLKNESAVGELAAAGCDAAACAADVADPRGAPALAAAAEKRWGRIDILVNNAGTNIRKRPEDLELDEWRRVIDTNLTSAFLCAQAVYPDLRRAGGGKIINIGSLLATFGAPFASAYGASKGGLVQLTKSLAAAWAADHIQVNAVLPGWIDTELSRQARAQVPGLSEHALARTPAGRWGTPDDLTGVAVFLASAASDFITGAAIPVDGGYSALL